MALSPKPKYLIRRTYVLKVRSDAKPDALAGHLENVVTGRSREFASGQELLDSVAGDLQASAEERSGDATASEMTRSDAMRRNDQEVP